MQRQGPEQTHRFTLTFRVDPSHPVEVGAYCICPTHLVAVVVERRDDAVSFTGCCPAGVAAQLREVRVDVRRSA